MTTQETVSSYIIIKCPVNLDEYEDYLIALNRLKDTEDRLLSEKELVGLGK